MRYLDENPFTVEELNAYVDEMVVVGEYGMNDGEYAWAVDAPYRITVDCSVDEYERGMESTLTGIETYDEELKTWKVFALDCDPELDISFLSDEVIDWSFEED
tara:strand:- start:21 stop:329 length:309 start_codon:yes stop_codon:yes gene_type:complete